MIVDIICIGKLVSTNIDVGKMFNDMESIISLSCLAKVMVKSKYILICFFFFAPILTASASNYLFPSSVTSNDLDFIHSDDNSAFESLAYIGTKHAEMPDKRGGPLTSYGVFIFTANYNDETSVGFWAHPDLRTKEEALLYVEPVAHAVGKLPTFMRKTLDHVVIHEGIETAFAEHIGHFFVMYSGNIRNRISTNDLEETVFHESVHATLDEKYLNSDGWLNAQRKDNNFITEYAASRPGEEDMAESALFAWAVIMHPGRLPDHVERAVKNIMPNRLDFFEKLFVTRTLH